MLGWVVLQFLPDEVTIPFGVAVLVYLLQICDIRLRLRDPATRLFTQPTPNTKSHICSTNLRGQPRDITSSKCVKMSDDSCISICLISISWLLGWGFVLAAKAAAVIPSIN